jgi:hypothetical protein
VLAGELGASGIARIESLQKLVGSLA